MADTIIERNQRITIPIFHVVFDEGVMGRIELDQNVILAQLNVQESKRVQVYHANVAGYTDDFFVAARLRPPSHWIEIFPDVSQDISTAQTQVHDRVLHVMSLLAIA